jgi:hypothetical protein
MAMDYGQQLEAASWVVYFVLRYLISIVLIICLVWFFMADRL